MMENHEFCDDCEGCRPAMLDLDTQKALPQDDPIMVTVNQIWDNETTYAQRRSFIEVTLHNSRNPVDLQRMKEVTNKFESVLKG